MFQNANGSVMVYSEGKDSRLITVLGCPCSDGQRRKVAITRSSSFFKTDGEVTIDGKVIPGHITPAPTYWGSIKSGVMFVSDQLPQWDSHSLRTF